MGVDQLTLGKITLRNMQGAQFITFASQGESGIIRHESVRENRERRLQRWRDYLQPLLRGKAVANYSTIAEPFRAQELAEQECARVIDILRYFIFVSNYITEQTRLELQDAGIYDLIDMYREEKKTDFSDTLLTGFTGSQMLLCKLNLQMSF